MGNTYKKLIRFDISMEESLLHEFDHLKNSEGYTNRSETLDSLGKLSLVDLLRSVASSIIIATHDIEFALHTCSRFLAL
jgi:hypothetical protein